MSRTLPLPIKEEFPNEQLLQVKMLPWFADIANFKAMKVIPKDFNRHQRIIIYGMTNIYSRDVQIIFYGDASRKKNREVSYGIVTVQIMEDILMEIGQLQKSYKLDFTGLHSSKMHSNL
ncbi:hypothetical protein PIB30_091264 [Stylosanthes scabra]|uniref:Uncharacterized protein n=1 Tax=Stylosanthes scabra TaxID=79078 RepID=A0ABU6SUZ7_9FABA|nr:hypothetical protein [Stylosanthes scabra]